MPGGKGNIKSTDGKPFEKGNKAAQKWTEEIALKFGNDILNWMEAEDENIFFEEFIYMKAIPTDYHPTVKIYPELITYLNKTFTAFFKLYGKAEKLQEIKLKKFGCFDKLNASMTKFTLINNHNWKEKSESDITTGGEKINTPDLSNISYAQLKKLVGNGDKQDSDK